jgi:D-alanine-D-alanine ligase
LLDVLAIPYTGSPTEALVLATSKLATKRALAAQGLPVPPVLAVLPEDAGGGAQGVAGWSGPVIVKSLFDHGSAALDDAAVLGAPPDLAALERVLAERAPRLGGACFAEAYVAGRELNLSILESSLEPGRLEVLPPAEIVFSDYPSDKPRIVGHRAKWEPSSFEYRHTPRRFDFPPADAPLLDELGRLARTAFTACGLRGYGRVDFRVDESGRPWILEVNANPCLSPDAGLAAAAERSGRHLDALVVAILDGALVRSPRRRAHQPAAV